MWYSWLSEDGKFPGESNQYEVAHSVCEKLSRGDGGEPLTMLLMIQPEGKLWRKYKNGLSTNEYDHSPTKGGHGADKYSGGGASLNKAWQERLAWESQLRDWGLPREAALAAYYLVFLDGEDAPKYWTDDEAQMREIIVKAQKRNTRMRVQDSRTGKIVAQVP
jgi:hypothetical protein